MYTLGCSLNKKNLGVPSLLPMMWGTLYDSEAIPAVSSISNVQTISQVVSKYVLFKYSSNREKTIGSNCNLVMHKLIPTMRKRTTVYTKGE
jgi:hypothetical protein